MIRIRNILTSIFLILTALGCQKSKNEPAPVAAQAAPPLYLYVASGMCYSGGGVATYTATTASNIIYRVNVDTGTVDSILTDYTAASEIAGSTPVSIIDYDSDYLLALIENSTSTAARRIEKVQKKTNASRTTYYSNATTFSSALASLSKASDGTLLINKTTAIEKLNTSPARVTAGANPWISSPAGNCASTATKITSAVRLASGKTIYTHANTAQNKIGVISSQGYNTTADCVVSSAVNAPQATAFPTASIYISDFNQLLVLYAGSGTTTDINSIYAYDVAEASTAATGAVSLINATSAFQDTSVLFGASAMAYDNQNGILYVATANSTSATVSNYNIEKFSYNYTTKTLTRIGSTPFAPGWIGSKCISSMFVGL